MSTRRCDVSGSRRGSYRSRWSGLLGLLVVAVIAIVSWRAEPVPAAVVRSPRTYTAGVNAHMRFAGSNVQCLVLEESEGDAEPNEVDCFYDEGGVGQMGTYHAFLDAINQVSLARTTITGMTIPGGISDVVWSDPNKQSGGRSFVASPGTLTLRLGDTVRIGKTAIQCLYQRSDIIDVGAVAVACIMNGPSPRSGAAGDPNDIFRVASPSAPKFVPHAIFVSDRVAAVMSIRNGKAVVDAQRRHFR